ncbi:MAG: hypothetical protein M3498_02285, partial [Deinococcota bacterium]|nr:hypothetical protein [Deinococcota bacterium]
MWLDRLLKRIQTHPGPVVLEGGESYGAPYLIEALSYSGAVIWLALGRADRHDPVAQGNALAEAVNDVLGSPLLPHGLPFGYGVEVLKTHLPLFGPITVALSNAHHAPLMSDALLELDRGPTRVVIDTAHLQHPPRRNTLYLGPQELALRAEEAEALAADALVGGDLETLYRSSAGAYLPFLAGVKRARGEPPPLVPHPRTTLTAPGAEALVEPGSLLATLRRANRHVEALDLAITHLPERVAEVLIEAGPEYQARGLLRRLHILLESLDAAYQQQERVLSWRLVAAAAVGELPEVMGDARAYLAEHEAPDLRARYAGALKDPVLGFAEARRAASQNETPLSLFQLGRLHPDPLQGVTLLRRSVQVAEQRGRPYEVARNAAALGECLIFAGHYQEAATWMEWALRFFDGHGLKDGYRRLLLVNNGGFARLMIGRTAGLIDEFTAMKEHLETAAPDLAILFRSTLSSLELVEGNLDDAERLAEANIWKSARVHIGLFMVPFVRILLEKGDVASALTESRRALELTAGESDIHHLPALLASGMVKAFHDPPAARAPLDRVLGAPQLYAYQRAAAAVHRLMLNQRLEARAWDEGVPTEVQEVLANLARTGLKFLGGPEPVFTDVWARLLAQSEPLDIRVLGSAQVRYEGNLLGLSERVLEVLV